MPYQHKFIQRKKSRPAVRSMLIMLMIIAMSGGLVACQPPHEPNEEMEVQLTPVDPVKPADPATADVNANSISNELPNTNSIPNKAEQEQGRGQDGKQGKLTQDKLAPEKPARADSQSKQTNTKNSTNTNNIANTSNSTINQTTKVTQNPDNQENRQPNRQPNSQTANQSASQSANQFANQAYQQLGNPPPNNQQGDQAHNSMQSQSLNQPLQGTQITKVSYQNMAGETLIATFQTSAIGDLKVQIVMANGQSMMLTAPQAGGNNPIYESADGSMVLVSHAGGASVDLVINGNPIEFTAVSADAEMVSNTP